VKFHNLSGEARDFIVQGGCFGEHKILRANALNADGSIENTVDVDGKHLSITLFPGTGLTLLLDMQRFSQQPSYLAPGMVANEIPKAILPRQREDFCN